MTSSLMGAAGAKLRYVTVGCLQWGRGGGAGVLARMSGRVINLAPIAAEAVGHDSIIT